MSDKTSPSNPGMVVSVRGIDEELFDVISGFEALSKEADKASSLAEAGRH
jgi:hypothetical protein